MIADDHQAPLPEEESPDSDTVSETAPPTASDKTDEEQPVADGTEEGNDSVEAEDTEAPEKDHKKAAILGGEIEVLPERRLPHLDKGVIKAYVAQPYGALGEQPYFAMVCENHLVPRSRSGAMYSKILNSSMAKLIGSGPVYWPPDGAHRYCFIYENTLGQPLMNSPDEQGMGWRPEAVMKAIVHPMMNILLDLRDADLVHGDIRPTNMFDGGSKTVEKVMLGECLSTPTSYTQPALFEPVERAMCDPIAKGKGTFHDDLYAFGVSLALMMRRKDPLYGASDEEIIRAKIESSTYHTVVGNERFSGPILELLRGLLHDDRQQRWSHEEIMAWSEGQRLSPKQGSKKSKASRPLHFNEEKYFKQSLLAMDLTKNPSEAAQLIENGQMEQWINRSLEDNLVKGRYEQAVESVQEMGAGPGHTDMLLSHVSIALDPEAPLRYKGLNLHPEGIPQALAEAYYTKKDLQVFAEIINHQIAMYWVTAQQDVLVDVGALLSRYDSCRAFLRQNNRGYGMERCLYFLNPEVHCLSDLLQSHYVRDPEEFMQALENVLESGTTPDLVIDRHVAAFLSVKDRKVIDAYWAELNAEEYHKRVLGNIKVLATIQYRARLDKFPHISAWAVSILDPIYERYHDRELRDKFKKRMEKLADKGDVNKIAAILDNAETSEKDFGNFRKAMQEYSALREEYKKIEKKMENPATFGKDTGKEVAAVISGFLAALAILAFSLLFFLQKGIF